MVAADQGAEPRGAFYEALRGQLKAHAERRFALDAADADGITQRKRLEGLVKRARSPDKKAEYQAELKVPRFPAEAEYLWRAFWRLRRRKAGSGFGPSPIEWPDIDAFCRHNAMSFTRWELETIEMLDDVYLAERARKPDEA